MSKSNFIKIVTLILTNIVILCGCSITIYNKENIKKVIVEYNTDNNTYEETSIDFETFERTRTLITDNIDEHRDEYKYTEELKVFVAENIFNASDTSEIETSDSGDQKILWRVKILFKDDKGNSYIRYGLIGSEYPEYWDKLLDLINK